MEGTYFQLLPPDLRIFAYLLVDLPSLQRTTLSFRDDFWRYRISVKHCLSPTVLDSPFLTPAEKYLQIVSSYEEIGYGSEKHCPMSRCLYLAASQDDLDLFAYFLCEHLGSHRSQSVTILQFLLELNFPPYVELYLTVFGLKEKIRYLCHISEEIWRVIFESSPISQILEYCDPYLLAKYYLPFHNSSTRGYGVELKRKVAKVAVIELGDFETASKLDSLSESFVEDMRYYLSDDPGIWKKIPNEGKCLWYFKTENIYCDKERADKSRYFCSTHLNEKKKISQIGRIHQYYEEIFGSALKYASPRILAQQAPLITNIKIDSDDLIPEMVPLTEKRLDELLAILWKMKEYNSGLSPFCYYYSILKGVLFPARDGNSGATIASLFRYLPRGGLFTNLQRYADRYQSFELKKIMKLQMNENFFRYPQFLSQLCNSPMFSDMSQQLSPFLTLQTQPQLIKNVLIYKYGGDYPYNYILDYSTLQSLIQGKKISLDNLKPFFLEPQRYLMALT